MEICEIYCPGIIGILLLLLIWGVVIEPRLVDFKAETAAISNLPGAWENKRVALIADLQIGMWLGNEGTVKKIVNRIIEERPAVTTLAKSGKEFLPQMHTDKNRMKNRIRN